MEKVIYEDLGSIRFAEAWDYQTSLANMLIEAKRNPAEGEPPPHHLLLCEHPSVYTLGKSGKEEHLLIDDQQRGELDIEFFRINRGGDITYHGPGQVVGYPIFDLDRFFTDVHKYVRYMEEVIIKVLDSYGIQGHRHEVNTGVWVTDDHTEWRKICAIGVHLSRWVTMHGFAFNVNTDLDYFKHIVPCGIPTGDMTVTSLAAELGMVVDQADVKDRIMTTFADQFNYQYLTNQETLKHT